LFFSSLRLPPYSTLFPYTTLFRSKRGLRNLFLLPALTAGLGLILADPVAAQTFTTLYSFTGGSDGAYPQAELILSGNTLYGTTRSEEHTSELQSRVDLVCRLLLEK